MATGSGDAVIGHLAIRFVDATLYRDDGVHLSVHGTDIFLVDLQQGIRSFPASSGVGGTSARLTPTMWQVSVRGGRKVGDWLAS